MTVVAVTGASGYIGRHVLEALEERPEVRRVVGIDVREPGFGTRNMEFYRLDIRSPSVKEILHGCDVLVHLAFVLTPMRDEEEMRDINVGGAQNVLVAAAEAGVRKIVYTSSVMAYGAHPDNDFPLTESSPIRPVREFSYSAHKGEVEGIVDSLRRSHPELTVTVLRPAMVLGPTVTGIVAQLVEVPWLLGIEGYGPPMQFVHEQDVARAVVLAVERNLEGAYDVCPDGWLSQDRIAEILGKRRVMLDYEAAYRRTERMWRLGLADLPPGYLPFLMYPWVMSNQKIREAGFEPLHTNEGALQAAVDAHRGWISIGRIRFRPRNVAAAAGGLLVAGSLLRRRLRRRVQEGA